MEAHGAGEGNRTLATSLEGWGSTTELHLHICDAVMITYHTHFVNNFNKYFYFFSKKTTKPQKSANKLFLFVFFD